MSNNIRTFADLNNKDNNKDKKQKNNMLKKNKSTMANDGYDNKMQFGKETIPVRGFWFASGKQVLADKDRFIYCIDPVNNKAVKTRPCFGSQVNFDDKEVMGKYPLCLVENDCKKEVPPKETNPIEDNEYKTPEAKKFALKLNRQKHINRVVEYIGGDWKTRLADQNKNGNDKHKYIVSNVSKVDNPLEYRRNKSTGHCYIAHEVKEMIGPECMENFLENESSLNDGIPYNEFIEEVMKGIDTNNQELRELKKEALMEFLEKNGFQAEYEELVKNKKMNAEINHDIITDYPQSITPYTDIQGTIKNANNEFDSFSQYDFNQNDTNSWYSGGYETWDGYGSNYYDNEIYENSFNEDSNTESHQGYEENLWDADLSNSAQYVAPYTEMNGDGRCIFSSKPDKQHNYKNEPRNQEYAEVKVISNNNDKGNLVDSNNGYGYNPNDIYTKYPQQEYYSIYTPQDINSYTQYNTQAYNQTYYPYYQYF